MKSVLNQEVSVFENAYQTQPFDKVLLLDWLTDPVYRHEVKQHRRLAPKQQKYSKRNLPAVTPSGLFLPTRQSQNLVQHSGIIGIDIDAKDNKHVKSWRETKKQISELENVAYCGLSVSGKGLFIAIPIEHPQKHAEHFKTLEVFFAKHLNLMIDSACKDVCRLRTISFDPRAYINHEAQKLLHYTNPSVEKSVRTTTLNNDQMKVDSIIEQLIETNTDITQEYIEWFQLGCVIANIFGEEGRDRFRKISRLNSKYNEKDCNKQFTACLKRQYKYTLGTFVHLVQKYS